MPPAGGAAQSLFKQAGDWEQLRRILVSGVGKLNVESCVISFSNGIDIRLAASAYIFIKDTVVRDSV